MNKTTKLLQDDCSKFSFNDTEATVSLNTNNNKDISFSEQQLAELDVFLLTIEKIKMKIYNLIVIQ